MGMDKALVCTCSATAGFHSSFDLDALDPRIAPGVGTPAGGGLTSGKGSPRSRKGVSPRPAPEPGTCRAQPGPRRPATRRLNWASASWFPPPGHNPAGGLLRALARRPTEAILALLSCFLVRAPKPRPASPGIVMQGAVSARRGPARRPSGPARGPWAGWQHHCLRSPLSGDVSHGRAGRDSRR